MTPAETHETKRILIVDDDPGIHRLLSATLNDSSRSIESAYDGLEGLRKFQNANWDLVITDVTMDGIDGMDLLERINRICPRTPVIVMTADTTADRIVSAIRGNAFSWLRKPFVMQVVREIVDNALTAPRLENDIEILSASPRWLELRLRCNIETATRVLHFVRELDTGLPEADQEKIALAFREILFNAVEHGGRCDAGQWVTVAYMRGDSALLFRVRDPGPGFSFDKLRHAATSNPSDSPAEHTMKRDQLGLRPGGFGILLARSLVDELIYNDKGNEALLIKYLERKEKEKGAAA